MNLDTFFNQNFSNNWTKEAVCCTEGKFTYSDFYQISESIAQYLDSVGCSRGDIVAIKLTNGYLFLATYLACIMKGFIFVPINPDQKEDEIQYILSRVKPNYFLQNEKELSSLEKTSSKKPNFKTLGKDTSAIFFTSGTTGLPKGVCHSIYNLSSNVIAFNEALSLNSSTRLYHILPMSYMAGFLNSFLSPILAGGSVLIGPKFNPLEAMSFWTKPKEWNANTIWITPTIASFLVRLNRDREISEWTSSSLNKVFCGTAPLTVNTRKKFEDLFKVEIKESYGMSEILLVSCQTKNTGSQKNSVGSLLKGIEVSSSKDKDHQELLINTPYMFTDYILPEGTTEELQSSNSEFMATGDSGFLEKGSLFISGRLKDIIIKGGINISPKYLENAIERVEGVEEVSVVGVQHEFWGEEPCAFLVLKENEDGESVLNNIKDKLQVEINTNFIPEKYILLDEMPRSQNGKIQKNKLKELDF